MAFDKVTTQDRAGKGNTGLPDTPALTTAEMQEQMDSLANLAIDKFNEFIDALNAATAAISVGCEVPDGITAQENVQSVINAMVTTLALCNGVKHSHSNKSVLDGISDLSIGSYNDLVTLFAGITAVDHTLLANDGLIPTSLAVKNFVDNYDLSTKVRNVVYPVGCVYSTTGTSPTTLFGGTWTLLDTDSAGVKRYERTA